MGGWISHSRGTFQVSALEANTNPSSVYALRFLFVYCKRNLIVWFWTQRRKNKKRSDRMKYWEKKIGGKMKGWDGIQSSFSSRSSSTMSHRATSQTVRLGRVQPQAPTHRTIFCNDREANFPVRFKVRFFFISSPILFILTSLVRCLLYCFCFGSISRLIDVVVLFWGYFSVCLSKLVNFFESRVRG